MPAIHLRRQCVSTLCINTHNKKGPIHNVLWHQPSFGSHCLRCCVKYLPTLEATLSWEQGPQRHRAITAYVYAHNIYPGGRGQEFAIATRAHGAYAHVVIALIIFDTKNKTKWTAKYSQQSARIQRGESRCDRKLFICLNTSKTIRKLCGLETIKVRLWREPKSDELDIDF